ncbi:MAG: hypothetical protein LQ345_004060 [Seirophora villosa]|nr:MAG: hypothetical protein LQ345_004060 [Seirophora villosa]
MAADAQKEGKNVFIGNIPYQLSEEAVVDIASTCGTVVSFRLVSDPETGRPRGYGFCEYTDKDAAASAIRNLDGYQVMGRELRVAYSHQGPKDDNDASRQPSSQQQQQLQQPPNGYTSQPQPSNTGLPTLPPGVDLPPGLECPDAISTTIKLLPTEQLLDILSQMKSLATSDPAKATELLRQAPQLSFAIFQAMLLMGLVDPAVLATVVEQAAQPPQQQQQAPPPQAAPPSNMPPSRGPPQGFHQPPPMPPSQQQFGQYGVPGHAPTPPVHNQPYQPPPVQQQPPPPQGIDKDAVIQQVLAMPQHEIDALPQQARDQIMQLKREFAARGRYA